MCISNILFPLIAAEVGFFQFISLRYGIDIVIRHFEESITQTHLLAVILQDKVANSHYVLFQFALKYHY